jgi:RNA polymerase-binding transcription factor DksA
METQHHGDEKSGWGERELKHFERRLLDERKRAVAQVQQFGDIHRLSQDEADGEVSSWRFHMADEGTDTFEREQSFLLASREGRLLWNIDEALRRLYRSPGSYGRCSECGNRIGYERLDAIPYAITCVSCKKEWEEGRAD